MFGKSNATPKGLQMVFLVSVSAAILLQLLSMIYIAINQVSTNTNLSSFYWYLGSQILVPLVFFGAAYAMGPRRKTLLQHTFESFIVAATGLASLQIVAQFVVQVQNYMFAAQPNSIDYFWWYELIMTLVVVGGYIATLAYLRTKKKWK